MPWPKVRATLEESPGRPRDRRAHGCPARVYHLLAKEAAYAPNLHHMDDFRKAR
jgi:hypothetical protein